MTDAIRRVLERVDRAAPFAPAAGLDRLSTWLRTVQTVPEEHRSAGEAVALALLGEDEQGRRLTSDDAYLTHRCPSGCGHPAGSAQCFERHAEDNRLHGPDGEYRWACKCGRCASWRANEATVPAATNRGAPWTENEVRVLRDETLTDPERAARLGRTLAGVTSARRTRGISSASRREKSSGGG